MSAIVTEKATQPTLADLLHKLGDVPLERVLFDPLPGTATEEDQLRLMDGEPKRLCELVEKTLVEKAMGSNESRLATDLIFHLKSYLRKHDLGFLTGADGIFRMGKRNRVPDVAFVSWRYFPNKKKDVVK